MSERERMKQPTIGRTAIETAVVKDDIYNLETAAIRCRVSKDQILEWIDRGLRAFPLGHSTEYRPRDYVIMEEWLLDFFRGRGVVSREADKPEKDKATAKKKAVAPKGVTKDQPLGPCPV